MILDNEKKFIYGIFGRFRGLLSYNVHRGGYIVLHDTHHTHSIVLFYFLFVSTHTDGFDYDSRYT